jgi:DNA (cytosine-5)-methyltransferase 1
LTFRYVSLFSGAGGLDIGLERAGLSAISLCEIERAFCDSLEENSGWIHTDGRAYFEDAKIIHADIKDVDIETLTQGSKLVDLVVGGPPCQAFSSSGKQLSVLDPRGALVSEFVSSVDTIRPKMFLLENVRGLVTARDANGQPGGVISDIISQFEEIGYSVRAGLLNAADYGGYQRRVRCFLIGSSSGYAPDFPVPTRTKKADMLLPKWRSLQEFMELFGDEKPENYTYPTAELFEKLIDIPNGSGLKSAGKAEPTRPGGHWGYRQGTFIADLGLPARTVTGSASQDWIRWKGDLRRLTFNEIKELQGFPSDWVFCGTKGARYKQIGNAVPALFGELLGQAIIRQLDAFPNEPPVKLGVPKMFKGYIDYTIRDHNRNASARTVQKRFSNS